MSAIKIRPPFPSPAGQHVALDPDYLKKHLATVAAAVSKQAPFDTFVGCGMGSIRVEMRYATESVLSPLDSRNADINA